MDVWESRARLAPGLDRDFLMDVTEQEIPQLHRAFFTDELLE
jgi:hypothetical protein